MTQINETFADRQSKISEALEKIGLIDLEMLLTPKSSLALGVVHVELYKSGTKVGEILYDREPPTITFSKEEYAFAIKKLQDYFTANVQEK